MKDCIFINDLTVFATIGVYDWEQQITQKLVIDVQMLWDSTLAAQTDDVQYCLNYAEVSQYIIQYVTAKPFKLLETLAHQLIDSLIVEFAIPAIRLTIKKPSAVPQASSVGIVVQRGNLQPFG